MNSICMNYITSERCNLVKDDISSNSIVPSASTIFYDLDDIVRRHSFHCLTESSQTSSKLLKYMRKNVTRGALHATTNLIVQECATQIYPNLLKYHNVEDSKRQTLETSYSSKTLLKDYIHKYKEQNCYPQKRQKYWSVAKQPTDLNKPQSRSKKIEKEVYISKRTKNPCPCQLFSYACPCSGEKSLTDLANNNKVMIVSQNISTMINETDGDRIRNKKDMRGLVKEDRQTNTSVARLLKEATKTALNNQCGPIFSHETGHERKLHKSNASRKVVCPKCKEKLNVIITNSLSTTEDEEGLKQVGSVLYHLSNEKSPDTCYRNKMMDQNVYAHISLSKVLLDDVNQRYANSDTVRKSTPRIIRITKPCRHQPPCTVVPSCQRANIIKSNCEYVPPCLHHPRCINLPLCAPFSKRLHYEETSPKLLNNMENSEYSNDGQCKCTAICKHESLTSLDPAQINVVSRFQNRNQFLNNYITPKLSLNRKSMGLHSSLTLSQTSNLNKSCQFNCVHCEHYFNQELNNDNVIFIRDVGCQFHDKTCLPVIPVNGYLPINSVLESAYSHSFEFVNVRTEDYSNKQPTPCENTLTNPITATQNLSPTATIASLCNKHIAHRTQASHLSLQKSQTTDFQLESTDLAAFSAAIKDLEITHETNQEFRTDPDNFAIRSRRSFFTGKHKIFSMKRRRKSKPGCHLFGSCNRGTRALK